MDNSVEIVPAPQFVINVVQGVDGEDSGFAVLAGTTSFVVKVMASVGGGASGEEYTQAEKDKLAAIEALATVDQTGLEIKTAYELEANTNAYTDVEKSKLAGIMDGATDDLTGSEIKILYEGEAQTNAYTDTEKSKLAAIEAGATADQTNTEIRTAVGAATDSNVFTDLHIDKLNNIQAFATGDQTDAEIRTAVEAAADSNVFTDADHSKLNAIEAGATTDQSDSEIETAYNAQVAKVSGPEITAGTEILVRRVSPADIKAFVLAHETGGSGATPADIVALSSFTPTLTDIFRGVDDPAGTPVFRKNTYAAIRTLVEANLVSPIIKAGTSGLGSFNVNADDLIIENNAAGGMTIAVPNTANAQIFFADSDDDNVGKIIYNHALDLMQFVVNTKISLTIDSASRILTGTAVPDLVGITAGSMTISTGNSGVTSLGTGADDFIIESSGNAGMTIASPNTGTCTINFADPENNADGKINYQHVSGKMSFTTRGAVAVSIDEVGDLLLDNRLGWGTDLFLERHSANSLAQRNGTNEQTFYVYNTYTDVSNYERAFFKFASNVVRIGMDAAGTGVQRGMFLKRATGKTIIFGSTTAIGWNVDANDNFVPLVDATHDLGLSNKRVRDIRASGTIIVGQTVDNDIAFKVTGHSLTAAAATAMIDLAGTWNTSGTPTAIKLNITNTASNDLSKLIELEVGGSDRFKVFVSGRISAALGIDNTVALTLAGYNLTGSGSNSLADLTGTLNTTGAPTIFKMDITDTASDAATLLMDLKVGGVSMFSVSKAGHITAISGLGGAPAQVSAQEIIDGTELELRSFSPDDIEAMASLHGGGGGSSPGITDLATANVLTIDASNRILFGTTLPDLIGAKPASVTISTGNSQLTSANVNADDLILENNSACGITIVSPNTTNCQIFFADPEDDNVGRLRYDHNVDAFSIFVNAALALTIDSSQRLLTGTSIPDVVGSKSGSMTISTGDSGVTSLNSSADDLTIEGSSNAGMTIATPNTATGFIHFTDPETAGVGQILYDHTLNQMAFAVSGVKNLFLSSNLMELRRGTTQQELRLYNTYTDAANYERATFRWSGNVMQLGTFFAGTGSTRPMEFIVGGGIALRIDTSRRIRTGLIETDLIGSGSGAMTVSTGDSGVTTPSGNSDDFIVEGSSNSGITIATPSTSKGFLQFADPLSNNIGRLIYDHSINAMELWVNGLEALTLDSSRRIITGGGTSDALGAEGGSLTISTGNSGVTAINSKGDDLILENDSAVGLTFASPNTADSAIFWADPESPQSGRIIYQHLTDIMKFDAGGKTAFIIDSVGRFITRTPGADALGAEQGSINISTGNSGLTAIHADADDLVIENSLHAGITIATTNSNTGSLFFGDTENNAVGKISYNHADDSMLLGVDGVGLLHLTANTVEQRNGTAKQDFFIYRSFTDASNYDRGFIRWNAGSTLEVGTDAMGTGVNREVRLISNAIVSIGIGGTRTFFSNSAGFNIEQILKFNSDNTHDIGQVADVRPRNMYLAGTLNLMGVTGNNEALKITGHSLTSADASSMIDLTGTWNTTGAPTAIKLDILDTASDAASLLIDLKVGGVSMFSVSKAGEVTAVSGLGGMSDSEVETAYNNQVAVVSAGEMTAGTEAAVRRFSPDNIENMIQIHGTVGSDQAPTRTIINLSASSTKVSVPDGVTWFRFQSALITVSDASGGSPRVGMEHTGTTDQTWTGYEQQLGSSGFAVNLVAANVAFIATGFEGAGTSRSFSGIVWSPRDATKKTFTSCFGVAHGEPAQRNRNMKADLAKDDATIVFDINNGTQSGSVEIEWFYDGGQLTDAQIKTAYENNADTNAFTDAEKTSLGTMEDNATADQTDAEIRAAVEAATDSNVFNDADHSHLNAIEALADVTDTTNVTAAGAAMLGGAGMTVGSSHFQVEVGTSYTLQASDNGKTVTLNNGSAIVLTVPTGLGAGFRCTLIQLGAGQVTVTASGTTLNSLSGFIKIAGQHGTVGLLANLANTFALAGDLVA